MLKKTVNVIVTTFRGERAEHEFTSWEDAQDFRRAAMALPATRTAIVEDHRYWR